MKKPHFSNLKKKDFWKAQIKEISISDILIWIAIALLFLASWQNIQAGRDPCSYCIINDPYQGEITCKEYFGENIDGINVSENLSYIQKEDDENIKDYAFRKNP